MKETNGFTKKELRRISQVGQLHRLMAMERGMISLGGAWICRLEHSEAKYMVAKHLWEWTQHVDALRHRLLEMPGGKPDAPLEASLEQVLEECLFAEDELAFLKALYQVIIPSIHEGCFVYLKSTQELPDRPTFEILKTVMESLNHQMIAASAVVQEKYGESSKGNEWKLHIAGLLNSVGGIYGKINPYLQELPRKFAGQSYLFPLLPNRPTPYLTSHFPPIDDWNGMFSGDVELDRVFLAAWLYNEIDAIEYIATILYEIKGMPWEFYYDVARHTWDEARHSEFGYQLLLKLGFRPEEFESIVATYMLSMNYKPHERYAAVTYWYEPGSFEHKPDFMEKLANEIGDDDLAVELLRFDLADETMHVRYGHKWVGKLMSHYNDQRTIEQLLADIQQESSGYLQEIQKVERTMPIEERMNIAKLKARIAEWKKQRGGNLVEAKIEFVEG